MQRSSLSTILLVVGLAFVFWASFVIRDDGNANEIVEELPDVPPIAQTQSVQEPLVVDLLLSSPDMAEYEMLDAAYTCDGEGMFPTLIVGSIPDETRSLALLVEDQNEVFEQDLFLHLLGMTPYEKIAGENLLTLDMFQIDGWLLGKNNQTMLGRSSPCPPEGTLHTYTFTVFALDYVPILQSGFTRQDLEGNLPGHIIGKGTYSVAYGTREIRDSEVLNNEEG